MRKPEPCWETEYAHDRRKHRHRCHVCHRILQAGDQVLMAKVRGKKTKAIHLEHADQRVFPDKDMTNRELLCAWGEEYLKSVGWS